MTGEEIEEEVRTRDIELSKAEKIPQKMQVSLIFIFLIFYTPSN